MSITSQGTLISFAAVTTQGNPAFLRTSSTGRIHLIIIEGLSALHLQGVSPAPHKADATGAMVNKGPSNREI